MPTGCARSIANYMGMNDRRHEHYYTARPVSLRQPMIYEDTLCGITFKFWTDHGVFSRGHTDLGSAELIDAMDLSGAQRILDIGCGYGVLGIVAAKLAPSARVVLTDANERAVELARQNLQTNGVTNAEVRLGADYAPVAGECFDIILTNPPAAPATRSSLPSSPALPHISLRPVVFTWSRARSKAPKPSPRRWAATSPMCSRQGRAVGIGYIAGGRGKSGAARPPWRAALASSRP